MTIRVTAFILLLFCISAIAVLGMGNGGSEKKKRGKKINMVGCIVELLDRLARVFRFLAHPQLERRALLFRVLLCHVLGVGCQPALLDPPAGRTR